MQPTNPNQFTEKAWEAIARTQDIVKQAQQQQIESEHLLKALLEQDGLASSVFHKLGIDGKTFGNTPVKWGEHRSCRSR